MIYCDFMPILRILWWRNFTFTLAWIFLSLPLFPKVSYFFFGENTSTLGYVVLLRLKYVSFDLPPFSCSISSSSSNLPGNINLNVEWVPSLSLGTYISFGSWFTLGWFIGAFSFVGKIFYLAFTVGWLWICTSSSGRIFPLCGKNISTFVKNIFTFVNNIFTFVKNIFSRREISSWTR